MTDFALFKETPEDYEHFANVRLPSAPSPGDVIVLMIPGYRDATPERWEVGYTEVVCASIEGSTLPSDDEVPEYIPLGPDACNIYVKKMSNP